MKKYEINPLDKKTIQNIWKELILIDQQHIEAGLLELWNYENYVFDIIDKWRLSFYIHDTNKILGYRIVSGRGKIKGYSHSHRTSILPCCQGNGLGNMLLKKSIEKSLEYGYKGMTGLRNKENYISQKFLIKTNWTNTGQEINKNELWKLDFETNQVYYSGCIIEVSKDAYIFQLRDNKPEISSPNIISTFGGRLENGESFLSAIKRELYEELGIVIPESNFHRIGYIEKYDEYKKHIVGCTYYYTKYYDEIIQCNEGKSIVLGKNDIITNDSIGDITKEMYNRLLCSDLQNKTK